MFAMAGGSPNHNLILLNVGAELRNQLKKRPCRVFPSDQRLKVEANGLYTYPDITVVCDEPAFDDPRKDTILNPLVLIEILSPSTEAYDRGRKFELYRQLPTLQEYVLVSQDAMRIDHYVRQTDGRWLLTPVAGVNGVVHLLSLDCRLELAEVYDKVSLEPAAAPPGNTTESAGS
jgi:Uma2 family endonuclease